MTTQPQWLIWSNEHGAWWKPGRYGYTKSRLEAGRYSFEEAAEICTDANAQRQDVQQPNEAMILDTYEPTMEM